LPRESLPRPAIVEVIGLPGAGKSAACKALLARAGGPKQSRVSIAWRPLRTSFVPRLLLPITLFRYRRVLRALRTSSDESWPIARAVLFFYWSGAKRLRRSENPIVSALFLLATFVTEIALARLESRLRRRTLIVDEGVVHRALGVWIRSAPAVRDAVMAAYLDTIPAGSVCIYLRCDPDTARTRALTRRRGIPLAAVRASGALDLADSTGAAFSDLYREQTEVFDLEPLRARVRMREIDAMGPSEEIAAQIEECLRQFGVERPLLVFLRE
jgi:broad-specificity NMP kinase